MKLNVDHEWHGGRRDVGNALDWGEPDYRRHVIAITGGQLAELVRAALAQGGEDRPDDVWEWQDGCDATDVSDAANWVGEPVKFRANQLRRLMESAIAKGREQYREKVAESLRRTGQVLLDVADRVPE